MTAYLCAICGKPIDSSAAFMFGSCTSCRQLMDPMPRKDVQLPPPIGFVARADYDALTEQIADLTAKLEAAEADKREAFEQGRDNAADLILDCIAKALGVTEYTACEGSETFEGDVCGTVYSILKAGDVYDDEDGAVASLRAIKAAEAERDDLREALKTARIEGYEIAREMAKDCGWHLLRPELVGELK